MSGKDNCWKGRDGAGTYVPGLPARVPHFRSVRGLNEKMACCTRCELAPGRIQVVRGVGPQQARVLFLGEAPGANEDRSGEPFVGAAGRLFNRLLERSELRREDVFITNVVACRPPRNRAPRTSEIRAHAPWLEEQLRLVDPEVVATLGRTALTWFLPGAKITELTGLPQRVARPDADLTILPMFHPAAALRSPDRVPALESAFDVLRTLLAR